MLKKSVCLKCYKEQVGKIEKFSLLLTEDNKSVEDLFELCWATDNFENKPPCKNCKYVQEHASKQETTMTVANLKIGQKFVFVKDVTHFEEFQLKAVPVYVMASSKESYFEFFCVGDPSMVSCDAVVDTLASQPVVPLNF
jgi:hypothetical protein